MNHGISLKAVSELHGRCWGVLPPGAGRGLYSGQIKGWAGGGGGVGVGGMSGVGTHIAI